MSTTRSKLINLDKQQFFAIGMANIIAIATAFHQARTHLESILDGSLKYLSLIVESGDTSVYFRSSEWILGTQTLYRDVPSEYPLLANLLFGAVRYVSEMLLPQADPVRSFTVMWIIFSIFAWAFCAYVSNMHSLPWIVASWMTPAVIFFSLYRYDVFPVLATILCFLSIKDNKFNESALWMGIAICLKGYAVFLVPTFFVYCLNRAGFKRALGYVCLSISPFLLMNVITILFSGLDGLLYAYKFHAMRSFNGESTWDALGISYIIKYIPALPMLLSVAFSLCGALLAPKKIDQLARSSLIVITGLVSAAIFYSPQFCLWVLSVSVFTNNKKVSRLVFFYCIATYFYYPTAAFFKHMYPNTALAWLWYPALLATTVIRVTLLLYCLPPRALKPMTWAYSGNHD